MWGWGKKLAGEWYMKRRSVRRTEVSTLANRDSKLTSQVLQFAFARPILKRYLLLHQFPFIARILVKRVGSTTNFEGTQIPTFCANRGETKWAANPVNRQMISLLPKSKSYAKDARHTMAAFQCTITMRPELEEDQAGHGLGVVAESSARTLAEVETKAGVENRAAERSKR
jgi:hypothetical protein